MCNSYTFSIFLYISKLGWIYDSLIAQMVPENCLRHHVSHRVGACGYLLLLACNYLDRIPTQMTRDISDDSQ